MTARTSSIFCVKSLTFHSPAAAQFGAELFPMLQGTDVNWLYLTLICYVWYDSVHIQERSGNKLKT